MPDKSKILVVLNVIATVILAVVTLGTGFGIVAGVFPPDHGVEIKMVLIAQSPVKNDVAAPRVESAEIPPEYRALDLTPSPWKLMADGSVQFEDSDRR